MPASQARSIASRRGAAPPESSHRTSVTTARAMWRARPGRRRSISCTSEAGSAGLDLVARSAMGALYDSLGSPWPLCQLRRRSRSCLSGFDRCLRVLFDEAQNLPPGVFRRLLVLLECAIEEGVGRAVVDHHTVGDARVGQLAVELLELLDGSEVGARNEQKEGCLHLRDHLSHPGGHPIEADATGQPVTGSRLAPGLGAAEAEADGEHRAHIAHLTRPEELDRRPRVGGNALRRRLVDVRAELEILVT